MRTATFVFVRNINLQAYLKAERIVLFLLSAGVSLKCERVVLLLLGVSLLLLLFPEPTLLSEVVESAEIVLRLSRLVLEVVCAAETKVVLVAACTLALLLVSESEVKVSLLLSLCLLSLAERISVSLLGGLLIVESEPPLILLTEAKVCLGLCRSGLCVCLLTSESKVCIPFLRWVQVQQVIALMFGMLLFGLVSS